VPRARLLIAIDVFGWSPRRLNKSIWMRLCDNASGGLGNKLQFSAFSYFI